MGATGDIGYKDRIEYLDNDGVTWRSVYQARKITPGKKTNRRANFTHLESPNRTDEFKTAFGEVSAYSFEAIYDHANATHGQVLSDGDDATQRQWRYVLVDSSTGATQQTHTFLGSVGEAGLGEAVNEEPRVLSATINVDGAVTRA